MERFRLPILIILGILWAAGAGAVTPGTTATPPSAGFDMTGFIQAATLDTAHSICTPTDPQLAGGTVTVNGIKMIIPCNTIVQMPATSMSWAQLFDPFSWGPISPLGTPAAPPITGHTGMALSDALLPVPGARTAVPFPSFEVHVIGNVVPDPASTQLAPRPDRYIVGLIVPISQQSLNVSSGLISFIDYATGAVRVGGLPNDPACIANGIISSLCSGALVQINDPVGRFGKAHSPDPRFTADTNNQTISTFSGWPVCIPRVAPPANYTDPVNDPLCPHTNRPLNGDRNFLVDPFLQLGAPLRTLDFPLPGAASVDPAYPITLTDQTQQIPLKVGDWVDYSGTLYKINPAGPNNSSNMYISAHTLNAQLGIFTAIGTSPAYVVNQVLLLGTGGPLLPGIIQETTTRIKVVGFATDPSRNVTVYAKDINPCTGQVTERFLLTSTPLNGPLVARGRYTTALAGGAFEPPTREVRVRYSNLQANPPLFANGLRAGQFDLPNFTFIFPETVMRGQPVEPFNFQDFSFLTLGSGPLDGFGGTGPIVGQLDPWPGVPTPPKVNCTLGGFAPIISAGTNLVVDSGTLVTLAGTATLDPNGGTPVISWAQTSGPLVALSNPGTLTPSFTAPTVLAGSPALLLTFALTVTDGFGTSTASVSMTVKSTGDAVIFVPGANSWRNVKGGKLTAQAFTNNPAATLTLSEVDRTTGATRTLGVMTGTACGLVFPAPGLFCYVSSGVPAPASLSVISTLGGSAIVTCNPDPARPGGYICP